MIRAGKLDRVVTLQRAHSIKNQFGTVTETWAAIATIRAQIVQSETVETASEDGPSSSDQMIFRMRWHPVTTADRLLYEGEELNIRRVREIGRRRGIELTCEA